MSFSPLRGLTTCSPLAVESLYFPRGRPSRPDRSYRGFLPRPHLRPWRNELCATLVALITLWTRCNSTLSEITHAGELSQRGRSTFGAYTTSSVGGRIQMETR